MITNHCPHCTELARLTTAYESAERKSGDHERDLIKLRGELARMEKERDAAQEEIATLHFAAHVPADYEFGVPTWINMVLYMAYIGLDVGPHNRAWATRIEDRWLAADDANRKLRRDLVAAQSAGQVLFDAIQHYTQAPEFEERLRGWDVLCKIGRDGIEADETTLSEYDALVASRLRLMRALGMVLQQRTTGGVK